ncbi:MAG: hypothetical protein DSY76_00845 [Bacteroidetes bacterium]|nr:MAG: hypothetical protein DSY76_00845 [Bacteroidota bacterium]
MKNSYLIIAFLIIASSFSACKKDEVVIPPEPIKDVYTNASFNYNFSDVDPKINPIFNGYIKTYESAVNQAKWQYNNYYSLKNLNTIIFAYDRDANNFDAVYMIVPPNGKYTGDLSDEYQTSNTASDGTKIIRVNDKAFLKDLINARLSGSSFGKAKVKDVDYLYFFFDKKRYDKTLKPLDIMREVGFFTHEGFHLTTQLGFKRPSNSLESIRFNLPSDYPADSVSFSLIASGIKMYESILFDNIQNTEDYVKMYYVLFKKLKAQDNSGKNYIDNYYLYECWLEGSAEFTEYSMNIGSGVMDGSIPEIRYDNSYQEFVDLTKKEIAAGVPPTVIYNGKERVVYYAQLVEITYYKLGSAPLFLLDKLGVDVYAKLKAGKNPYQMLEEYITANNISVDEEATYEELKSQINWEDTKDMMQDYIELFN